jgi:hypothetical protein
MKIILLTLVAIVTASPASARDCLSQSQARRISGDAHLYYRVNDGVRCWYAKEAQRAARVDANNSPFRDLVTAFIPVPQADVEEEPAPRPKAKRVKAKYKKIAKRHRTPTNNEDIKYILCGDNCPNFRKMGNLRKLNDRRAREYGLSKQTEVPKL